MEWLWSGYGVAMEWLLSGCLLKCSAASSGLTTAARPLEQPVLGWCAAGVCRAFATLGHYNTALLEAMCSRLIALLEPFSGPGVPLSLSTPARNPNAFPSQAFANSAW